jgi:hypothetical protein
MLKGLLFSLVVAGCTGTGAVQYSASAEVATPTLVEVEPGVQVVADYDQPVFFSDGFYWRYDAGYWYRSPYYNRAWVSVSAPPVAVRQIQRPEIYAHYHADARVRTREARVTPQPTPEIREHRAEPPRAEIRDRNDDQRREDERRDEQRREQMERRDDKRDDKAERREDKRDEKADKREEKAERHDEKRDDHKHHH